MSEARPESAPEGVARALEFQRETLMKVADAVASIPEGWVIRTPALPLVWALNQVRVGELGRQPPLGFEDLVGLVDRHLGELPYRHLTVEHEPTGAAVESRFRAAGWRVEREVTMILAGAPDREVDTGAVIEAPPGEVVELLKRWMEEDALAAEAEQQLVHYWRLEWEARGARLLGIRGQSGALAAITMLYSDGATAQVENVYTVPEERGHGFGRALVSGAVALARSGGHELTFIVADDCGWPKELYARLGFTPAGRGWAFHRDAPIANSQPSQRPA